MSLALQRAHSLPIQTVITTSVDLELTDSNKVVLVDATSGSKTITLPQASNGLIINIKKVDSSTNSVIIDTVSGTIDGVATKLLGLQYQALTITSDGINFFII